jgi:colanic acid/amylovoran biosynthesis glycosyltransferase
MCPAYLVAAEPAATARRMRTLLWFAHPSVTRTLAAAERLADAVLTSLPGSYPRSSSKVRVIGQAIDTGALAFAPRPLQPARVRLVAIGRTSPAKGFDVAIRAVAILREEGMDATLQIVGPSTTADEQRHREELVALASRLGVSEDVGIEQGVPPDAVADLIRGSDIVVNAMVAGSGDKVVFEALALGRPVLVSNPSFAHLLANPSVELRFAPGDARVLADRIAGLSRAGDLMPALVSLRGRVEREHSLAHWADSVMAAGVA